MRKRTTNKLTHRVEVHGNIKTTNEIGETTFFYGKLKTIWAHIVPQTGSLQRQQADNMLANVTHKIIVRYNAGKELTKDMQIHYKNHRFEIKYVLNPYYSNETLEVFCQELID